MLEKLIKSQFLPKNSELSSEEIKKLVKILNTGDPKETLIRVLEWQNKNITYWDERNYMFILLNFLIFVSLIPIFIILNSFDIVGFLLLFSLWFVCLIINIYFLLPTALLLNSSLILLISYSLLKFGNMANTYSILALIITLICLSISMGGLIAIIIYLSSKYKNIKSRIPEFKMSDTFFMSLPVSKILNYRLAICKDYAKLTSALLANLFPDSKIYFLMIPRHVAAGIELNSGFYVLDQKLPITSLNRWIEFWTERFKKRSLSVTVCEFIRNYKKTNIRIVGKKSSRKPDYPLVDTKNLEKKLVSAICLKKYKIEGKADIEIPLKLVALKYEKDEIIEDSFVRYMLLELDREVCDIKRILAVQVVQEGKDLMLRVWINKLETVPMKI